MLEDRENVEKLTIAIEEENALEVQRRSEMKKARRKEKTDRKSFWSRFRRKSD